MSTVRHRCLRCGGSCQGVAVVPVDDDERERLAAHARALGVVRPFDGPALRRNAGRCVFLDADGCRLHAALGPLAKPRICRQFPLVAVRVGQELRVGVDPGCYRWPAADGTHTVDDPVVAEAHGEELAVTSWVDLAASVGTTRAGLVRTWRRLPLVPWLESLQTAPLVRASLLPVARAAGRWDPEAPPPWPTDPVGLEGLRRMARLRLTPLSAADLAVVGLVGGVGCGWAAPGDPAPLAAWWRIVRTAGFAATVLRR